MLRLLTLVKGIVGGHLAELGLPLGLDILVQHRAEIQPGLLVSGARQALQQVGAADQRFQRGHTQARQPFAGLRGDEMEEVHHHLDRTIEVILSQFFVLRGDTSRTVIEVTDT